MANESLNRIKNHILAVLLLGIANTNLHAATFSDAQLEQHGRVSQRQRSS
jgi:hypothetical protein